MSQQLHPEDAVVDFVLQVGAADENLGAQMRVGVDAGNFSVNIEQHFASAVLLVGHCGILIVNKTQHFSFICAHYEAVLGFAAIAQFYGLRGIVLKSDGLVPPELFVAHWYCESVDLSLVGLLQIKVMSLQVENVPVVAVHVVVVGKFTTVSSLQANQLITDLFDTVVSLGPELARQHSLPDVLNRKQPVLIVYPGDGHTRTKAVVVILIIVVPSKNIEQPVAMVHRTPESWLHLFL